MKIKAQKPIMHRGKAYKPGEILDVPDIEAVELIKNKYATAAMIATESDDPGDDVVEDGEDGEEQQSEESDDKESSE